MITKDFFPGGKRKALTLSYDDGIGQDIRLAGLLRQYGVKCTFNINGGKMSRANCANRSGVDIWHINEAEILSVYEGFELALHSFTHPALDLLTPDVVAMEIVRDREALERLTGAPVRGMAYPFGTHHAALRAQLAQLGVVYARTVKSTHSFALPEEFLAWNPTCHHNDSELMALADKFLALQPARGLQLFYLWGHSYEFDIDDNWARIEAFCEKVAGQGDIWYATNMEIYGYMQAQDRLVTTCAGDAVYNPSAIPVWVCAGGAAVRVGPGETVRV